MSERYCDEEKARAIDKVLEELSVELTGQFVPEEAYEHDETVGKWFKRFDKLKAESFRERTMKKVLLGLMDSVDAYTFEMYRSHSSDVLLDPFADQLKGLYDLIDTFPQSDFTFDAKEWCYDLYKRISKAQLALDIIIRMEEF